MAFDDSTGGIDRAQYASTVDIWGDSQGDRSINSLWDSMIASRGADRLDQADHQAWLARQAAYVIRLQKHATRRRSAPVEKKIKAERLANSKTAMGAAFRDAYARQRDRE